MLQDREKELKDKEEELKKQLEKLRSQKAKLQAPKEEPKLVPAEASPYHLSAAASLRAKFLETDVSKKARAELTTHEAMWNALKGDSSTVAVEYRAQ